MKQFVKNVINKATAYYTIAVLLFCITMLISFSGAESISLAPTRTICILPFCLCFAIANTILNVEKFQSVSKWILHFTLTVLGAFIFLILPAELPESSGNFMGFIIILAFYIVGIIIYALFSNRIKRAIREDNELKKQSLKKK